MSQSSNAVMNWRNRAKERLVLHKGGKCEKCGYSNLNYLRVFEFHHLDASQKDFTLSGKSWSYPRLQEEVDKCILVCSNCHKEIHEDLDREKREERLLVKRPQSTNGRGILKPCVVCNTPTKNIRFCGLSCHGKFKAEENGSKRPSKQELLLLKQKHNNIEISKMFAVSEAAVRGWLKNAR